jgi:cardiolipin synthase
MGYRPDITAPPTPRDRAALRGLAERALTRAAGGPLVAGNAVRVLDDARENYPAWLDAVNAAERRIAFENYIIAGDATGRRFADALAAAARRGVRVRLLYDWLGCLGERSRPLWRELARAGCEVRAFNTPRLERPLACLSRDHRKSLAVDGRVGFVSGLCVSDRWAGDPARGREAWRDTGVELRGPAVGDVERAFAAAWATAGAPIPASELPEAELAPAGDVAVRVVATEPHAAGLFRLDLLVAGLAQRSLWLADAYFFGTAPYVEALRAAARDGVDVRLLVPGTSDIALLAAFSRAGYRPLLEAGIRVFEWNGPMMHAKTAVADGRWARIGSSNLNLSSWLGNYELDVTVEDEGFAREMEARYLSDLEDATEIVLRARRRRSLAPVESERSRTVPGGGRRAGAGRAAAGAIRVTHAVGAALTGERTLGPAEARVAAGGGIVLVVLAAVAALWPRVIAVPAAAVALWLGAALLLRAAGLARAERASSGRGGTAVAARQRDGPRQRDLAASRPNAR